MGRVNAPPNRRLINPDADGLKFSFSQVEALLHRRGLKNIQQTTRTKPAAGKFEDGQEGVDNPVFQTRCSIRYGVRNALCLNFRRIKYRFDKWRIRTHV